MQAWFLWTKAAFAWSARSSEHGRLEAIRPRSLRIFNTTNVSMSSAPWWYRPEVEKLSCVSNRMSVLLLANRSSLFLSICFLGSMVRSSWCGITIRFIIVRRFKRFLAKIHAFNFPSYAPELNPVEFVWTQISEYMASRVPATLAELRTNLQAGLHRTRISQSRLWACIYASDLPSFPWEK